MERGEEDEEEAGWFGALAVYAEVPGAFISHTLLPPAPDSASSLQAKRTERP